MLSPGLLKTAPRRSRNMIAFSFTLLFPILILPLFVDCSGHYLRNRMRDAADVFTVEFSTRAGGVSARVGPLKAGAYYKSPEGLAAGLRGGRFGRQHTAEFTALFVGADYFSAAPLNFAPHLKNQEDEADTILEENGYSEDDSGSETGESNGDEDRSVEPAAGPIYPLLRLRKKEFRAAAPFGTVKKPGEYHYVFKEEGAFATPSYFTQIEINAGLFFAVKIGFNPGELLDFLLGLFTVDIYGDDAPFRDPRLEKLEKNPYFRDLDPETKKRIMEELGSDDEQEKN